MKDPFPKSPRTPFQSYRYLIESSRSIKDNYRPAKKDFIKVVSERRSAPILREATQERIHELLYYASKVSDVAIDDFGNILTRRTAPSAGALHPIDMLCSFKDSLANRNIEYYDPLEVSLNKLKLDLDKTQSFFQHINTCTDISESCVLWFAVQIQKTSSKYENAESLYWRDAGALIYCVQLFASYLGLSTLPIGTLASGQFKSLFGSSMTSAGGILIGEPH